MKIKSITAQQEPTDHVIYIDTDSIFCSTQPMLDLRFGDWRTKSDAIIAEHVNTVAQEMQDYLNDFYDMMSLRFYNVPRGVHRLEIKKEYVAKAGIWIAKKRYAQWIISDKGVPVDKLDIKGLDAVRSSFPKAFRDLTKQVLIDILKKVPQETITENILTFKRNMPEQKPQDIANNSAIKEISKYQKKVTTHLFDFMKGTPAHVKAAITYNDLLKHFKSQFKYEPMKDGDKIKWAYMKPNPLGLDTVGFTGYNDPKEILDFIDTYIDHDKAFEKALLSKLQDFYDALKWGVVVTNEKKAGNFFSF